TPAISQACRTVMPAGTSSSFPSIFTMGMRSLRRQFRRWAPGALADATFHFRPEMADQSLHRPRRTIRQRADRVALDLLGDVVQRVDLLDPRVTRNHAFHHAPDPAEPLTTGRALAAALVFVEIGQPRD